jgi:hypothetical protein
LPNLTDQTTQLAQTIRSGNTNVYDTVLAVQAYLRQNYTYSLDVQRTSDRLPLEDFLFVNQAGHCEYYATSMAMLLRILGIPTRVVNGFARGRWNEFGNFFTVRQSDAHAWVEVYFPSYGWITFDPTPSAAFDETYQQFVEQRSLLASVYRYSEYLRTRWNRYIIDYSATDQARMVVDAFRASHSARHGIASYLRRSRASLKHAIERISLSQIGILIGSLLVIGILIRPLLRVLSRLHLRMPGFRLLPRTPRQHQIVRLYQKMLHTLARQGLTKPRSTTPAEFAEYVAQHHPAYAHNVREITRIYYETRYGQQPFTDNDLTRLQDMLMTMRTRNRKSIFS